MGAFALLCWDASSRLGDAYPSFTRCLRDPEKHHGKPVWFQPARVVAAREGSFDLERWGGPVRIHAPLQPPVGARVMVYGTFQREGTVTAIAWDEEPNYFIKRLGVLVVSMLVVIVGAFVFHRSFEWRGGAFHPRESHSAAAPQKPMERI